MSIKNKMGYINMEGANNKSTDNDCIICLAKHHYECI